ncbi:unnamed protein product [Polarella glacialis]|uniref:Uncharacterized protein n=1 Tax=Polarella glacialis TaxID=89957 RepID=A0A813ETZ9_POLGL|nr:unnamed protein product [Polarella glacialis]
MHLHWSPEFTPLKALPMAAAAEKANESGAERQVPNFHVMRAPLEKQGTGGDEIEEDSSDEADGQEQGTDPPVSTSPEMNERPKEARSSGGSETGSNAPTVAATSAQRARKGATRRNSKANPSRGGAHGDSQDEESSGEGDKSATTAFLRAITWEVRYYHLRKA